MHRVCICCVMHVFNVCILTLEIPCPELTIVNSNVSSINIVSGTNITVLCDEGHYNHLNLSIHVFTCCVHAGHTEWDPLVQCTSMFLHVIGSCRYCYKANVYIEIGNTF